MVRKNSHELKKASLDLLTPANRQRTIYRTKLGSVIVGQCERVLSNNRLREKYRGKVQLIFTSPPFPLNKKKQYGNLQGEDYLAWLAEFGPLFSEYLKPNGSVVIEIGNAWEKGSPTQSVLPYRALLAFVEKGAFKLCQEITYYNPAKLPTPAQWVTIERIRLKDSTSKVWWMSKMERPKAHNKRVAKPYSEAMRQLLRRGSYNSGKRPSEHRISENGFLKRHAGAIPPNLIEVANTRSGSQYQKFCREFEIEPHPARMPEKVAEFFIKFLTDKGDLVLDPFSGSNTTGAVANRLGRRWIAIESIPIYAAAGVANLSTRSAATILKKLRN